MGTTTAELTRLYSFVNVNHCNSHGNRALGTRMLANVLEIGSSQAGIIKNYRPSGPVVQSSYNQESTISDFHLQNSPVPSPIHHQSYLFPNPTQPQHLQPQRPKPSYSLKYQNNICPPFCASAKIFASSVSIPTPIPYRIPQHQDQKLLSLSKSKKIGLNSENESLKEELTEMSQKFPRQKINVFPTKEVQSTPTETRRASDITCLNKNSSKQKRTWPI